MGLSKSFLLTTASVFGLVIYVFPDTAKAKIPEILREETKPLELRFGLGPSFFLNSGGSGALGRASAEVLYHFSGKAEGPALGGIAHSLFLLNAGGLEIVSMFA